LNHDSITIHEYSFILTCSSSNDLNFVLWSHPEIVIFNQVWSKLIDVLFSFSKNDLANRISFGPMRKLFIVLNFTF
jgi:hypothetical protein